jgi:molybdate transport system substrate-binding protein
MHALDGKRGLVYGLKKFPESGDFYGAKEEFGMGAQSEIMVFSPGGTKAVLLTIAESFERETGDKVNFTFGTGGGVQGQILGGAAGDVAVLPSSGVAELGQQGFTVKDSQVEVGRIGVGVGIRAGAPRPRIGTTEEFKSALLDAKSITYADPDRGGTSGAYFAQVVLGRLGIAGQLKGKTVLTAVGGDAVRRVADGQSEMVIVQASEITAVPGAELVGPLPDEFRNDLPYAAVILKKRRSPELGRALV